MTSPDRKSVNQLDLLLGALALFYPLIALVALRFLEPHWVALVLGCVVVLRVALGKGGPLALSLAALCAVGAMALMTLHDSQLALRLYPVFMGLAMLTAFAHSLFNPPSLIEIFARMREPDLPPEGVVHTRRVTFAWCVFLACNAAVALYTAIFSSLEVWAIYNGAVSYGLMGLMFFGELLIRKTIMARADEGSADR
ncbi:MAG: hypothetical protein CME88_12930 [Hirschia sp.]|nr:hypothetical protein [Hirschia sp.]MBF19273.1 hypothetical protein [Hirschia sp.]